MVGIDSTNKNTLDPKYICPKCSLILRDPVQLINCGHRQCQSCFNALAECPQCQVETPHHQVMLDRGFKTDMQSIPINCSLCQWTGILKDYQIHLNQSHLNPKCEHCDRRFNSVESLNEHKVSECQNLTIDCALKDFGCNEQIIRGKAEEHYRTLKHQETVMKIASQMDPDIARTTTTTATDSAAVTLQQSHDTLNILSGRIEMLNDDAQRLSNESLQGQVEVQALNEDVIQIKESVEETRMFLEGVKLNQDILNQNLTSLKEKIDEMLYASYDGTFTWKITNFREKMMNAQSERQTSIYSPPFYSSSSGYKMRVRLYPYGDGNARGTYMSIFFVLMRGLNDSIVKFPFNYMVAFCMYDQTSERNHIIESFQPNIRSKSFQRPQSEMNIASGIPKFFPLTMIEQENNPYVQDDTMFIKVMVNFEDMPKTLLPYAFSLNPGVPTYAQQLLIKQEAERRTEQLPEPQNTVSVNLGVEAIETGQEQQGQEAKEHQ